MVWFIYSMVQLRYDMGHTISEVTAYAFWYCIGKVLRYKNLVSKYGAVALMYL